jgi:hypothetical protein
MTKANEMVFLHIESKKSCASICCQHDHNAPYSTTYWMPETEMTDGPFALQIPEDTPEGDYFVHVGFWNPLNGERSLDVYLPIKLTVSKQAIPPVLPQITPLPESETAERVVNLLRRFHQEPLVRLDSDEIQFRLQPESGCFLIKNARTGMIWQSPPNASGFGIVSATNGNERVRLPLSSMRIMRSDSRQCVLANDWNGSTVLTVTIRIERNGPSLVWGWTAGKGWQIDEIEFDPLLWTTETQGGGAIISRLIGQYFKADSGIELTNTYGTYEGWGGLHMPMAGILREHDSALLSWNELGMTAIYRSRLVSDKAWPGRQIVSVGLRSNRANGSFRLDLVRGNSYVDLASAYRERAKENGTLVTLKQKARRSPHLDKLFGAPEFKPFVCVRRQSVSAEGKPEETVHNHFTEHDCLALAKHLHDDLHIKKALFVLAGWIHRGYDNQHPDILPTAPEIGGDEGVRRISSKIQSYNWLFGLHDNYQDIYENSPSWDPAKVMMDANGERMKGGIWAGGQAWLTASNHGLEFAKINLPEVRKIFNPNAYFIDTTYATPLYQSFDPVFPLTVEDDLAYKLELSRYTADLFGIHGSETGFEFGVPVSHYFEGILSGKPLIQDFPEPGAMRIPLFPLVFGDCVILFSHQGDRAGLGDARLILNNLVYGSMPLYEIAPRRYWETEIPEPDFSDPNFCFAQGDGGWGRGKHVVDRFIKNTYEFLSPFAEGVATLPMTDHRYLKDDLSVEYSEFGDEWMAIVNYGPQDYVFGRTALPPMGFVATGPDFLAQHYYPDLNKNETCLIVKHDRKTYYGFR